MTDARYRGVDERGRPYTVTASTAVQVAPEQVDLTDPKGDITQESGTWLMLQSKQGVYHPAREPARSVPRRGAVPRRRHDASAPSSASIDLKNGAAAERRAGPCRRPVRNPGRAGLHRDGQGRGDPVRGPGAARDERAQPMIAGSRWPLGWRWRFLPRRGPGAAQQLDLSHGGPIDITATDGIEWRQNEKKVIARGNARAVRENVTVTADRLIAYYRRKPGAPEAGAKPSRPSRSVTAEARPHPAGIAGEDADTSGNEIYRVEAEGHVHIFTPTDHAEGDRAIYDLDQAVLLMTGQEPEADHAAGRADGAGQPGILVAEAHGRRARGRGRRDQ